MVCYIIFILTNIHLFFNISITLTMQKRSISEVDHECIYSQPEPHRFAATALVPSTKGSIWQPPPLPQPRNGQESPWEPV